MLAYILAIALALASLSLYLSAFFVPEIHRKDDFLWSGVGLFYALILWICAGRITGSVLLGQGAAVALVLSFGWQMVRLRRAIAHPDEQTNLEGVSLMGWLQNRFSGKKPPVKPQPPTVVPKTTPSSESQPKTPTVEESTAVTNPSAVEDLKEELKVEEIESETEQLTVPPTTVLEKDNENELDFEPFIADNEAETVIETYEPQEIGSVVSEKPELTKEVDVIEKTEENSESILEQSLENPEESTKEEPPKES